MTTEATGTPGPRTIKASEFKAKCLKLMDEVAESGEEIVITKNGRPVSRLVPYRDRPASLFGIDRGRIEILGDIIEPIDVEWEAQYQPGPCIESVILLDTHVMLWLRLGDARLGPGARSAIDRAWQADEVCVSAICVLGSGPPQRTSNGSASPTMSAYGAGSNWSKESLRFPWMAQIAIRAATLSLISTPTRPTA